MLGHVAIEIKDENLVPEGQPPEKKQEREIEAKNPALKNQASAEKEKQEIAAGELAEVDFGHGFKLKVPHDLLCPIGTMPIRIALQETLLEQKEGVPSPRLYTYEGENIIRWLGDEKKDTSPITRQKLTKTLHFDRQLDERRRAFFQNALKENEALLKDGKHPVVLQKIEELANEALGAAKARLEKYARDQHITIIGPGFNGQRLLPPRALAPVGIVPGPHVVIDMPDNILHEDKRSYAKAIIHGSRMGTRMGILCTLIWMYALEPLFQARFSGRSSLLSSASSFFNSSSTDYSTWGDMFVVNLLAGGLGYICPSFIQLICWDNLGDAEHKVDSYTAFSNVSFLMTSVLSLCRLGADSCIPLGPLGNKLLMSGVGIFAMKMAEIGIRRRFDFYEEKFPPAAAAAALVAPAPPPLIRGIALPGAPGLFAPAGEAAAPLLLHDHKAEEGKEEKNALLALEEEEGYLSFGKSSA